MEIYDPRVREVVWQHVYPEPNTGCWLWGGYTNHDGYGRSRAVAGGRLVFAHRIVFEALVRALKPDEELDHLCRTRPCVNPHHLEPVTHEVNVLRGVSFSARNRRKTHCKRGHKYVDGSYYKTSQGGRLCKECHKIQQAHHQARIGKGGYRELQNVA